jgi:hypothetical protein
MLPQDLTRGVFPFIELSFPCFQSTQEMFSLLVKVKSIASLTVNFPIQRRGGTHDSV